MEQTITLTIPANWLQDQKVDPNDLRRALQIGLAQLRQQAQQASAESIVQALLSTGRVRHLAVMPVENKSPDAGRQKPPTLQGTPVSEILISQRRGEL